MTVSEANNPNTDRWVLFATISASSMAFIGGSSLNVATAAIQRDLGASGADLLWIFNAFNLVLAALILVGGSLGDHYGRKRIYMIGIGIFTGASVICAIAPTTELLIAARAVQGFGGALMIPGSLAIISAYFEDSKRGAAIGTWSAFTTLTSVMGPVLGGFLAEAGLWRMVFVINIPLGIAAMYALVRYVPESKDENASPRLDYLGATLVTLAMAGITYGFIELGRDTSAVNGPALAALIAGIILMIVFVIVEARIKNPMMSLKLFQSRTFTGANLLTLFLYAALGGALFFLPLNLVQIQGYGETQAGFALLPFSILLILMSRWAGGLVDRVGPRLPLTIGPIIVGFGFLLLALPGMTDGPGSYFTTYMPGAILLGLGMGVVVAPLTTTVMSAVPQHNAGIASGINNAISRSSNVFALAIMGGIALIIFSTSFEDSLSGMSLDDDMQQTLNGASENMGNIEIPAELSTAETAEVRSAIDNSFIDMFRAMMIIAVGLCWLSALLAYLVIEDHVVQSDDSAAKAHAVEHVPCMDQQLSTVNTQSSAAD